MNEHSRCKHTSIASCPFPSMEYCAYNKCPGTGDIPKFPEIDPETMRWLETYTWKQPDGTYDFSKPHVRPENLGLTDQELNIVAEGIVNEAVMDDGKKEDNDPDDIEMCDIFGVELTEDFNIQVPLTDLEGHAINIWQRPSVYSDYIDGSEDAYYKFTKFLWIKYSNGTEVTLSAYVNSLDMSDMEKAPHE